MRRLALSLSLLLAAPAWGATYYVRTGGSDANNCTDATTNACATIARVLTLYDLTVSRPHTIDVGAGTFRMGETEITTADQGAAGAVLTIHGAGAGTTILTGLTSASLADAGCTVDPTYSDVYNCGTVTGAASTWRVYETVWSTTEAVFDDRPTGSGGKCSLAADGNCTGARYAWPHSPQLYPAASLLACHNVAGSIFWSGTTLYIHAFDGLQPDVTNEDYEVASAANVIRVNGADYVTIENLSVAYARDNGILVDNDADHVTLQDLTIYSNLVGFSVIDRSDFAVTQRIVSDSNQVRTDGAITLATCGPSECWYNGGSGNSCYWSGDAADTPLTGMTITDLYCAASFNAAQMEDVRNSTISNSWFVNAANHSLLLGASETAGAQQGSHDGTCAGCGGQPSCQNNVIERSIAMNAQEGFYVSGCNNSVFNRVMGGLDFNDEASPNRGESENWRVCSSIVYETSDGTGGGSSNKDIAVIGGSVTGFESNYNWYKTAQNNCRWTTSTYQCDTTWKTACTCDATQSNSATVTVANATLPISQGAEAMALTAADLYLTAASTQLVDQGSTDINCDGVVDGSDVCNAGSHCYGTRPDIGPFEYGIDGAAAAGSPGLKGGTLKGGTLR